MANRIQLRRGGAQEWANSNPTLAQGELGIELDTGRFKIGDGVSAWNSLRYERPVESTSNTANTLVQRDADGNFAAGTITSTLIGNASTATRLASTRQIQLSGDIQGSGVFDGSQNLNLVTTLELISTLPHYDGTAESSATYTKVTVDAQGRIKNASTPSTLADYNLNGTVEGSSAQPYDLDLVSIAGLTTTGMISRTSAGNMQTRTITGTAQRIQVNEGAGLNGNPTIDLVATAVTAADYNTASTTSAAGSETVNAGQYSVDTYGRITAAATIPIATATQGTTAAAYNAGTTYSRGDQITNASKLYQAIAGIAAGAGAPTHSDTSDAGSWRYLAASATPQKGLASFDQEDFDVSASGHVTMALGSIDNDQLQNSRISFADGNAKEDFDLDQELTATTGYRGFNKLNYVKINDTSGNLLFGANNTGDSGAGEIDVNVRSYFSDADITLDGGVAQTLNKTGDGNLTFTTTQNSTSARSLTVSASNSGSGNSSVIVTAENAVTITASDSAGKVQVEDTYFQGDYIASSAATMILDPGDDRAVSGKVQIMGDLQVDGTTTTINSTVTTIDDPIITLGGDSAPGSDDNKDRGVEFRYYDSQARVGFFGYDDSANDLGGHAGSFTFLYNATNTAEVFSGTDAGIIAGNIKLTTGTASTTNTTGDLVVAGGAGIGGSVNIGGSVDIDTNLGVTGTSLFTDEVVIKGASKNFILKDGSNNAKITAVTTSGNLTMAGILAVTGNVDVNSNKFNIVAASGNTAIAGTLTVSDQTIIKADAKYFKVQTAAGVDKFTVDTDNGNTDLEGTLNVGSLVHLESTDEPNIALNNSTDLYEIQSSDYGALRVDGGGFFDKAVLFDSDIYLNGDFNQRDSGTESWGLRNWLQVRYKIRAGSSVSYNPSYSNHNTSNLRVYGGAGVNQNLHVGATGSGEGLFVGKKNSGDTVKFQVLGATGNITSEGTLTQNGNAEFNGTVDVDANFAVRSGTTDKFTIASSTGNAVGEGDLNIKGAVDLDTTLNVDGTATIQDDLIVKSDNKMFKVQTAAAADKFTVDTDNGNTVISGTLQVDGQINVNDSVVIDEANEIFSIRNGSAVEKFGVDTDNGNTNIIGTLTVGDATQINDTFGTSGVNTFTNNTEQTLTGSYAADGSARFSGGIGLAKNLAVGGGARVYGNTELTGTLDLNNNADISGTLTVNDQTIVKADNKFFKVQNAAGVDKFTVDTDNGNIVSAGELQVAGDTALQSDLVVTGNLTVNGTTTTVNSTVTTYDDPIVTLGGDTAPSSNDAKDRGIEFRYYDGSAKIGFFGFDRSSQQFAFLTSATNSSEVLSGTDGALRVGSLNVTGAGTSVDIDNNLNVDGTATVDGQIISQLAQGTAPFVVASTTKVSNLNADLLDGMTTATANTVSTVVNRDGSGNFAAGTITAALTGNASTATTLETARNIAVAGVVSGTVSFNGSADVSITTTFVDADITALAAMSGTGYVVRTAANTYAQRTLAVTASSGITLTNPDGVSGNTTINVASASTNAANNLVLRDGSGDFAANEITSDLVGNLTGATSTAKDLNPASDSSYDLGTNTVRWQKLYADAADITAITGTLTGNVTGNITGNVAGDLTGNIVGTTSTAKNLNPAADSTYDLGTTSVRWQNIYGDAANITAITGTLTGDVTGDLTGNADSATLAATVTVADESTDTSCNVLFTTAATGSLAVKSGTNLTFNSNTGILTATGFAGPITGAVTGNVTGTVSSIANHDTDALSEGSTNLYFTNERVDDRLNAVIIAGTGVTKVYDDAANTYTLSVTQADVNSDNITEGSTNLFTTAARTRTHFTYGTGITHSSGTLSVTQADINTDNITEGSSKLFFTDARADARIAAADTGDLSEGSNLYYTDARANARVAAATGANLDLSSKSTTNLSEGTNQYYTEARVQAKLDNAYAQLSAMLNNLATATTLTLNLSGDPTPGSVVTLGSISAGGVGGFTGATNVATTGGTGSGLTVDTTVNADGIITGLALNAAGTGYLIGDTLTITNPNLGGVDTLNLGTLSGGVGGFSAATGVATSSSGSGTGLTLNTTVDGNGAITNVAINAAGSGYAIGETITIANSNAGGASTVDTLVGGTGYANGTAIATTGGGGSGLTLNLTTSNGVVTAAAINAAGSGYAVDDTITIVNANASGAKTLGSISQGGTGYAAGSGIATTSAGSGTGLTVDVTVSSGVVSGVTINDDGSGYAADEVITITNANATGAKTLGSIATAGTGYSAGSAIATTSSGSGTGGTVDITVGANGAVTGVTINDDGSGYAASEVLTITNANASGINTVGNIGAADASRTAGTYNIAATDYASQASGQNATFTIVVNGSGAATVTVVNDGDTWIANETVTVADAQLGGGGGAALTFDVTAIHGNSATIPVSAIHGSTASFPVSAIHGNGATVDIATIFANATINTSTVFTNATFALSDITTMEVGATVTGGTSGTTGVITALGATSVTVDNVDGFFKVGETVGANDVTNLTISSFA